MNIIQPVSVRGLFDVIMAKTGVSESYLDRKSYCDIYHVTCGGTFSAEYKDARMYRRDESDMFYCPHCGKRIVRRTEYDRNEYLDSVFATYSPADVPVNFTLSAKEYKHFVDLEIRYQAVCCRTGNASLLRVHVSRKTCVEIIRADIRKQTIQVINRDTGEVFIADPIRDPNWPARTLLRRLSAVSNVRKYRSGILAVFGAYRKTIERKLQHKLGYRVPSFYSPPTLTQDKGNRFAHGMLHGPLRNLAWRLAAPTAPSFDTDAFTAAFDGIRSKENEYARYDDVLKRTRAGEEYFHVLQDLFHLPKSRCIRSALRATGPFSARAFYEASKVTDDVNHVITLAPLILGTPYWYSGTRPFLRRLSRTKAYGPRAAIHLLKKRKELELHDTLRMYNDLKDEYKAEFWRGPRRKLRDLHNAMQALYDKQRYASLPIPQTTLQRLPVEEVDGMEFYTPAETGMFAVISEQLRNCVKSYRVSAANGDIAIVGVRDKNRIVACIEVRLSGVMQPVVVQAKLADNVKLLRNEKINNALLHWAQRQNLRIKTDDVAV